MSKHPAYRGFSPITGGVSSTVPGRHALLTMANAPEAFSRTKLGSAILAGVLAVLAVLQVSAASANSPTTTAQGEAR